MSSFFNFRRPSPPHLSCGSPAAARFASTFTRSALEATAVFSPAALHCSNQTPKLNQRQWQIICEVYKHSPLVISKTLKIVSGFRNQHPKKIQTNITQNPTKKNQKSMFPINPKTPTCKTLSPINPKLKTLKTPYLATRSAWITYLTRVLNHGYSPPVGPVPEPPCSPIPNWGAHTAEERMGWWHVASQVGTPL